MPENQERLRQSLLADLTALHGNLSKTWAIVLSLPIGKAKTNLELIHQSKCEIRSQHEEDFDGNGLALLKYKVGDHVLVKLSGGRIVEAAVKALTESTDGVRLQVSFGSETALIDLWQVVEKID
jgi:hypothetical protein